jgi:hypothetical protein
VQSANKSKYIEAPAAAKRRTIVGIARIASTAVVVASIQLATVVCACRSELIAASLSKHQEGTLFVICEQTQSHLGCNCQRSHCLD